MPILDRDKRKKYGRLWIAKRRQDWLDTHGPCCRCGGKESLEIDHIDPSTKVTHAIWSWAERRRNAELDKCQVLCHNCHLEKTARDYFTNLQHGSYTMRYKYHCICFECADFIRTDKREWRKRTGKH